MKIVGGVSLKKGDSQAYWIDGTFAWVCSNCGGLEYTRKKPYCGYCGKRMSDVRSENGKSNRCGGVD